MTQDPSPDSRGYRFNTGRPWTPAEVLALEVFARSRLSRTQAGMLIGRNHNEVAGICHRRRIHFSRNHAS